MEIEILDMKKAIQEAKEHLFTKSLPLEKNVKARPGVTLLQLEGRGRRIMSLRPAWTT
jgi:hypothetical protein